MPIRWPSVSRRSSSQGSPKKGERAVSDPPMRTEDSDSVPADATEALLEQTAPKDLRSIDPGLSRIVTDAALYEQVVSEELSGGASPELTLYESLRGFSRLVGKDLDSSEKHASIRLAQLSVNNWASNPFREPVDIEEEPEESSPEVSLDETPSTLTLLEERTDDFERLEAAERELEATEGSRNLHPDHIVHLLENEFGCLAGPGEEKLLLEADCALVHDVLLLGVLHLTNRRISFHASLLSTKPDDTKIIKAGPVTVRLKGWRRKRRVWMELSHDIICTYPSSKDEHRIKPYRSILLSSIKSVEKLDKDHPRVVRISYEGIGGPKDDTILEFDTVESAREWNREVHGAAFLYRQNRRRALEPDNIEDANGVRFNIPLSRLDEVDYSIFMSFANLVKLKVAIGQQLPLDGEHVQERSSSGPSGLSASEALSAAIDRIPSSSDPDDTSDFAQDTHTLQIAILKEEPELRNLVSLAKEARTYEKTQNMTVPQAYFDFDATGYGLDDFEGQEFNAIANVLGIRRKPWTVKACITRRFSRLYGTFVVADEIIGFISKSITLSQVMYRIPIARVVGVRVSGSQRIDNTLVLEVHGQSDIRFSFRSEARRDEAMAKVQEAIDKYKQDTSESLVIEPLTRGWDNTTDVHLTASPSPGASPADSPACSTPVRDGSPVPSSKRTSRNMTAILAPLSRIPLVREAAQVPYELRQHMPKAVNIPPGIVHSLNVTKMHVVCLTIGSRGDVQPYIALARGLQAHGHTVTIVTHEEYKTWVEGFGVGHRTAGGDPGALMKLSVENRMFSPQFFKESLTNFRTWLDQLLIDAWEQCKDADLLLESPSAMAGVHIAEALKIPYFRTFTMPWTKTRAFPHAFLSPPVESPTFNSASYVLFDNVFWAATSGQINRWRKSTLKIGPTDMGHMAQSKIPFIYNFSSAVVPKPLDYGDTITFSGYWFLDNPDLNWEPPQTLLDFMKAARDNDRPLVYIGFGSIVVPDPTALAKNIIQAVVKANARAIISRGWSARMAKPDTTQEVEYPEQCYVLDKVPHDWLFPQMDAVVHHGGAGTTGASLRAGVPTLIRPWFGDQFFWASRVQKLGAGIRIHSLRSELADALIRATTDRVMKEKASMVGERIRSEDGVASAIEAIYMYLPRARRNRAELD